MKRERPLLFFALVYPTLVAWFYFVLLAGDANRPNPAQQTAYGIGKAFQFVLPLLFFWWFDSSRLQLARPRFDRLGFAIVFSLVTAAGMFLLYFAWLKHAPVFGSAPERIGEKLRQFGLNTAVGFLAIGLFVSLLHSLLEEYYWRWFLFGRLRDHFSFLVACVLSSFGFMAHHVIVLAIYFPDHFWTAVVPLSLCIAAGGAVWAWLYERTKTIYAAWISHLLIDVTVYLIGYDLMRSTLV